MKGGPVLLLEEDHSDEALIVRALRKANVGNEVVVARDGVDALDYLFGASACSGHGVVNPILTLLDPKLPNVDGLPEGWCPLRLGFGEQCRLRRPSHCHLRREQR